jgi:hypothetical protein
MTEHESSAPQWRTTSDPAVEPDWFGRDHWSTFAYIETRIVDHRGTLNHAHMRCHGGRHPLMLAAKGDFLGVADGRQFATLLAAGEQLPDHDDYDCIDDLIAAGLLEVHMPKLADNADGDYFIDAYGKPACLDDDVIHPDFVTGRTELELCAFATFSLTERGKQVASDLRAHKGAGGNFATFRMG